MKKYDVETSITAEMDISEIMEYIATEFKSIEAALNTAGTIKNKLMSLSNFPERFPFVHDENLARQGWRWIKINNYIAFYSIEKVKNIVYVERVLYKRRQWEKLL